MTRETTNWLRDAWRAGNRVIQLAEPLDYEAYHSNEFPRIGIERYLITVGDALRAAMHHNPSLVDRLPDARNAIDLRNFLTHAYLHIDDMVVWNVIREHLPRLLEQIEDVLRES